VATLPKSLTGGSVDEACLLMLKVVYFFAIGAQLRFLARRNVAGGDFEGWNRICPPVCTRQR